VGDPQALPAFDQLPYFDEYLREVLRPRVERAVQSIERSLEELVWRKVAKMLASEQPGASDETPAMIRQLLEKRLGLSFQARLGHTYSIDGREAPSAAPVAAPADDDVREGEVVTIRRNEISAGPLAQAVLAHPPLAARR
jgi:hypothetical protein